MGCDLGNWKFPSKQGNNVWRNLGIQSCNSTMLWHIVNIEFVVASPESPSVGHCWNCHCMLNLMVTTCVLNQSKGHWLLFDVSMITINLIVAMEFQPNSFIDGSETCDQFDVELQMLNKNMQQEVVKVIRHSLQFLMAFDSH